MKQFILFLLTSACLYSCSVVDDPAGADCKDISESEFAYTEYADFSYSSPCYNPYNANQFVYCKTTKHASSYSYELRMFDSGTSEDRFLCDGYVEFQPAWANADWIFFERNFQQWKVKTDGSGLEMITGSEHNLSSVFNRFTNRVSFYRRLAAGADENEFFYNFYDPSAMAFSDSIYIYPSLQVHSECYDWIGPDEIVTFYGSGLANYGMYRINFQTFEKSKIMAFDHDLTDINHTVTAVKVTPDGQHILWADGTGIYRINIAAQECVKLKNSCGSATYMTFSISPDGQTILADRRDREQVATNTIKETFRIVKMNIDGSNEQILGLPE